MLRVKAFEDEDGRFDKFNKPIGKLYFAGEAHHAVFNGFVHGAYFSGLDTANEVIKDI